MPESKKNNLRIPQGKSLYPFQVETVEKTLRFLATNESHACYVASEMGLGKSITSLITANTLNSKRTLIICPAVMRLVWREEIYSWCRFECTSIPRVGVVLTGADAKEAVNAQYVICSYNLAAELKVLSILVSQSYDLLIVDEAHAIKSRKAKRTAAVIKDLWPKATYKILLSGTPMTRNVIDCYIPFHAILPKAFPSFALFAEKYSYSRVTKWAIDYYGLKNAEELSQIIRENFYIRYKKEDVLKELPAKQWQKILLPGMEYSVKIAASNAEKLWKEKQQVLDAIDLGKIAVIPASLAEHRRLQGEAKVDAVVEFAAELLSQEIPLVIFAHHKSVIKSLTLALSEFNPVVITGETNSSERMRAIEAFQAGEVNCFIGNMVAAGTGITLTRSNTVLFAELDWVPATVNQASDRVHRIGQKNQVTIYYFVVQDSIDATIEELVISRTKDFNKLLDASA